MGTDFFIREFQGQLTNLTGVTSNIVAADYANTVYQAEQAARQAMNTTAQQWQNLKHAGQIAGWLAEDFFTETANISSKAKGFGSIAQKISGNKPEDLVFNGLKVQSKFHRTAKSTYDNLVKNKDKYEGMLLLVPEDQIKKIIKYAEKDNNFDMVNRLVSKLSKNKLSSGQLTQKQIKAMAAEFKETGSINFEKYGIKVATEDYVDWSDIARESGFAALHAAAFSMALTVAPHVWGVFKKYIQTGIITKEDITAKTQDVLLATNNAGLRGGIAAILTTACGTGKLGHQLKSPPPEVIGMVTTLLVNTLEYSIKVYKKEMSQPEMAYNCMKDVFALSAGFAGTIAGQALIPIPLLGGLVGNVVGSMLSTVVFDGAYNTLLGLSVHNGWTMLGIVEQDYVVPSAVLQQVGYDLISTASFGTSSFSTSSFTTQSFSSSSLSFKPIRRGVINCGVVGYI